MSFIDSMFQAPAGRGRLNRKQIQNKDDQAPDPKPGHVTPHSNCEKPTETTRYGAQRRLQEQKKKEQEAIQESTNNSKVYTKKPIVNSASDEISTLQSKVVEKKSVRGKLDKIKINEKTENQSSQKKIITPRYGANRRINQDQKSQISSTQKEENPSEGTRRLQRKPMNQRIIKHETPNQTPKKQEIKRVPLPAQKLSGQKLEEVQNIVRRPLNRRGAVIQQQQEVSKGLKKDESEQKPIEKALQPRNRPANSRVENQRKEKQTEKGLPYSRNANIQEKNAQVPSEPSLQSDSQMNDKKIETPKQTYKPRKGRPGNEYSMRLSENQKQDQNNNTQKQRVSQISTPLQQTNKRQSVGQSAEVSRVPKKPVGQRGLNKVEQEKKQTKSFPLKRSNAIIYSMSKMFKSKMIQNFGMLKSTKIAKCKRLEVRMLTKIMQGLFYRKYYKHIHHILVCLKDDESESKIDHKEISKIREQMMKKNHTFLPTLLNRLFREKERRVYNVLKKNIKMENPTWVAGFHSIGQRIAKAVFQQIRSFSRKKVYSRKIKLQKLCQIAKLYLKNNLSYAYLKLSMPTHTQELKTPKSSRLMASKQSPSPITNKPEKQTINKSKALLSEATTALQTAKSRFEQMKKTHDAEQEQLNDEQSNCRQNLEILKGNCFEEEQTIEQKKRVMAIMKQKIEQIQIPEEDYIKEDKNLTLEETRYPLVLELYLHAFKNKQKINYSSEQLDQQFPFLAQDAQNDIIVQRWATLIQNKNLKQLMEAYEGISKVQRKAAQILAREMNMITDIARSYIKQKYIWGWVKLAVSGLASP